MELLLAVEPLAVRRPELEEQELEVPDWLEAPGAWLELPQQSGAGGTGDGPTSCRP